MHIEAKIGELGLVLPEPPQVPPGITLSFAWVRMRGNRAYFSGHGALNADGSIAELLGKVGGELSVDQGYNAARLTALSVLASLKRELDDLDRVTAWLFVQGFVNTVPGLTQTTNVINGFSDLIVQLYGETGEHARFAVGVAALPLNVPVSIGGEVEIAS